MTEREVSDSQNSDTKKQKLEEMKEIEFYSQSIASFFATTIEKDKSILTISAGGIGFLITLINLSEKIGLFEYIIFILASFAFIISIVIVIKIFGENSKYIISMTTEPNESKDVEKKDAQLNCLDKIAMLSFQIGLVLAFVLGSIMSYQNITKETPNMSNKERTSQTLTNESFAGTSKMQKSFSGANQVKPNVNSQSSGNSNSSQQGNNASGSNTSSKEK